ncbi:MAG: hypothetical protein MRY21_08535 [Simkaniaceae bacterium]|nr:hypothetical protein [Simkaniaceae bacterium]
MKRAFALTLLISHLFAAGDPGPEVQEQIEKNSNQRSLIRTPRPNQTRFSISPLFTGPLLTPSGHVVQKGHVNFEPYLFVTTKYGKYNKHWEQRSRDTEQVITASCLFQWGLTKFMDIKITPQIITRMHGSKHFTRPGDLAIGFDFQLLEDLPSNRLPGVKIGISEIFPLSKYNKLNPDLDGADSIGGGSFVTVGEFVVTRTFHFSGYHYLGFRSALVYLLPAPTHVRGFNSYGGGYGTAGKVWPGQSLTFFVGLEYSLDNPWVLALDVQYVHQNKTRFTGNNGIKKDGSAATVASPSREQIGIAPAIEYNWNANWGIIFGGWATIAGRNSDSFASGVVAVNYYK